MKQEIQAYNELLDVIHATCEDLHQALVGDIVVSEVLEETQRTLLMNEIPLVWKVKRFIGLSALELLPAILEKILSNNEILWIMGDGFGITNCILSRLDETDCFLHGRHQSPVSTTKSFQYSSVLLSERFENDLAWAVVSIILIDLRSRSLLRYSAKFCSFVGAANR